MNGNSNFQAQYHLVGATLDVSAPHNISLIPMLTDNDGITESKYNNYYIVVVLKNGNNKSIKNRA